jgi:CRISPR/Cas system Type II protein with McrA/HNH and RuvC-like nuclease domain
MSGAIRLRTLPTTSFLDEFWEDGPQPQTKFALEFIERVSGEASNVKEIRRVPLTAERKRLGQESGWKCFYCGKAGDKDQGPDGRVWHVDHAYPFSRGGDDQPDNHVLACATCNLGKKAATAAEYFRRLESA